MSFFLSGIELNVVCSCLPCQILCTFQATMLTHVVSIFVPSFSLIMIFPFVFHILFLSHLRLLFDRKNDINILEQIIRYFKSFVEQR